MTDFDPTDPNSKLRATRWGLKLPTGWGVWIFLAACAVVGAAVVIIRGVL